LSLEECLAAVDECNAPIVSIPGGEPLIHKQIHQIVEGIIERKKFVYLCTNALLLAKHIDKFTPSPYLTFSIHLDGNRERHDASVCQTGVYDKAIKAIKLALDKGFRVTTNYTLFQGESAEEIAEFLDMSTELGIESVTIAPGYNYEAAPEQDIFLRRSASKRLFREIFKLGRKRKQKWRFNQSSLYLDYLAGNQSYQCTPWGNPTRNVFGWQKPCYLLADEGYASSFKSLIEDTDWDNYGYGRNVKCADCMVHCGYEPTAVNDTFAHPLRALKVALRGPRTEGPMAPEVQADPLRENKTESLNIANTKNDIVSTQAVSTQTVKFKTSREKSIS